MNKVKVAIVDNSIYPELYKPVEHWCRYFEDAEWEAFRAPAGRLPALKKFSHIILTGSEGSILERERWVEREVEFVYDAFQAGRSILGSCYGHQLLALALAGPPHVGRCREPEIGWIPIEIRVDSRLIGPQGTAYAFSIHFDEVRDLPDSFVVLAATDVCPIQAFGLKDRNIWGLQIHPEIDVVAARSFLENAGEVFPDLRNLFGNVLASSPRDSRLILRIIKEFLAFSA